MKILIAYDGSACSRAALDDLKKAGLPEDCEVVVLSVAEVWLPPPSSYEILGSETAGSMAARKQLAFDLAEEAAERVRSHFPGWHVVALSNIGSPAGTMLEHAEEFRPDLIVVGSHGFSTLERITLGSVSQRIVSEARCSVRVARGRVEEERETPVRLLLAVDGSEDSDKAVEAVRGRRWPAGSEVKLITCAGPNLEKREPAVITEMTAPIAAMQEEIAAGLRARGLEVTTRVSLEDPKRAIVEEAESWGADSIFIGSRGLGRISRFFLGSVSSAVTARAHCSVEVIR